MHQMLHSADVSVRCIERIRERCGAIIHELQTLQSESAIEIRGQIGSWHGKQLASEAARELFPGFWINNRLRVITRR